MRLLNTIRTVAANLVPTAPAAAIPTPMPAAMPKTVQMTDQQPVDLMIIFSSPLADERNPTRATALHSIYMDLVVQRAAGRLAGRMRQLVEVVAYRSAIAAGIANAQDDYDVPSAQAVAATLMRLADAVDDQLATAREDHAAHDDASKWIIKLHQPLRFAVSAALDRLAGEYKHADGALDAMKCSGAMSGVNSPGGRYAELVAAGLNEAQIKLVDPSLHSPEQVADIHRQKIAAVKPVIERLRAWAADPFTSPDALIAGLDEGVDSQLAARAELLALAPTV